MLYKLNPRGAMFGGRSLLFRRIGSSIKKTQPLSKILSTSSSSSSLLPWYDQPSSSLMPQRLCGLITFGILIGSNNNFNQTTDMAPAADATESSVQTSSTIAVSSSSVSIPVAGRLVRRGAASRPIMYADVSDADMNTLLQIDNHVAEEEEAKDTDDDGNKHETSQALLPPELRSYLKESKYWSLETPALSDVDDNGVQRRRQRRSTTRSETVVTGSVHSSITHRDFSFGGSPINPRSAIQATPGTTKKSRSKKARYQQQKAEYDSNTTSDADDTTNVGEHEVVDDELQPPPPPPPPPPIEDDGTDRYYGDDNNDDDEDDEDDDYAPRRSKRKRSIDGADNNNNDDDDDEPAATTTTSRRSSSRTTNKRKRLIDGADDNDTAAAAAAAAATTTSRRSSSRTSNTTSRTVTTTTRKTKTKKRGMKQTATKTRKKKKVSVQASNTTDDDVAAEPRRSGRRHAQRTIRYNNGSDDDSEEDISEFDDDDNTEEDITDNEGNEQETSSSSLATPNGRSTTPKRRRRKKCKKKNHKRNVGKKKAKGKRKNNKKQKTKREKRKHMYLNIYPGLMLVSNKENPNNPPKLANLPDSMFPIRLSHPQVIDIFTDYALSKDVCDLCGLKKSDEELHLDHTHCRATEIAKIESGLYSKDTTSSSG